MGISHPWHDDGTRADELDAVEHLLQEAFIKARGYPPEARDMMRNIHRQIEEYRKIFHD